ncbi:hypothetical protein PVAP13_1KG348900 [Panicum virgatum]|uniref:Uncharacterized protein n=1 Tax=Panicum virgatum TaxID=38727 RepID=A0A8T0XQ92_PANVG|nr:hypothetical protein PVAP13_1KG348900 [Panicum virgatum]
MTYYFTNESPGALPWCGPPGPRAWCGSASAARRAAAARPCQGLRRPLLPPPRRRPAMAPSAAAPCLWHLAMPRRRQYGSWSLSSPRAARCRRRRCPSPAPRRVGSASPRPPRRIRSASPRRAAAPGHAASASRGWGRRGGRSLPAAAVEAGASQRRRGARKPKGHRGGSRQRRARPPKGGPPPLLLLMLPRPARSRSAEEREADWACRDAATPWRGRPPDVLPRRAADPHEHRAMAPALELWPPRAPCSATEARVRGELELQRRGRRARAPAPPGSRREPDRAFPSLADCAADSAHRLPYRRPPDLVCRPRLVVILREHRGARHSAPALGPAASRPCFPGTLGRAAPPPTC